ncbi:outer membrane immunogenic protein [Devosia subaequoris]|uniref:Outer membrane immunogenic protein n=1 Tax=Devosia subaequoris TaxID=395930 RepID=A0A7W6IJW7_9HYPH|nr:porin family protein [Devosia subaequoris]MBB4050632.1 outer membrane immunogenic protein [Devosia subaequoris]MCP1208686.1 porin family protein [Devosia subaequoris]
MRIAATIALAALATTVPAGAAMAADLITVPTSTQAELPMVDAAGFDWSGFYAGVHGTAQNGSTSGTQYGLGIQAGVNAQFDFYLLGAEVAVSGLLENGTVGETTYGQVLGRAGLVVSDNVAVYAAGGYGIDMGPPGEEDALLGGGVELAVTDDISVRAQYLHGFPVQGGNDKNQFTLGASYHF